MIKMSALKFINNMLITQTPGTLYSKLKINKRTCSNISFKYFPKLAGFKCTVLYRGISYYNQLPTHFKLLQRHKFKEKLKNERYLLKQLLDQVVMVQICYQGEACHLNLKDAPFLNCIPSRTSLFSIFSIPLQSDLKKNDNYMKRNNNHNTSKKRKKIY